jgi:hypothetical protein
VDDDSRSAERNEDAPDRSLTRELAVVAALRLAGESKAATPDEDTRTRMRRRITQRLTRPLSRGSRGSTLARVLVAAVTLLVALGGLSLLLSKNALPGDPLYDLKRVGESATLGLTFDDQAKGFKHLQFATTRLDELSKLAGAGSDERAYETALTGFDDETRAGTAQLDLLAAQTGGQQLGRLRGWVAHQTATLNGLGTRLPAGVAAHFRQSAALLDRVDARVTALTNRLPCYAITSGESDDLGPVPAGGACEPQAGPAQSAGGPPPQTGTPEQQGPVRQVTVPPDASARPDVVSSAVPTATLAPPASPPAPVTIAPPIVAATGPRLPDSPPRPPPLISVPPLIPGLPGVGIG